jgi:RNA polymerase sigma-70 factor (ECF subfamily)
MLATTAAPIAAQNAAPKPADARAFEALFDAELPYVWTSLRRLGVAERDLEDVAHELFLQVLRNLPTADTTRPARPWLFAFAVRFAADYRRLARHRGAFLGDTEPMEPSAGPEALLAAKQREALVLRALEDVDFDRRAVFVLHELEERSMPEVAETLGLSLNTGYSRLRVAREEFAASVRRLTARGEETP